MTADADTAAISKRLNGKVAMVTGGGRGIGLSLVRRLAAEGANIVVNDLDADPAADAARIAEAEGARAIAVPGDVTDAAFPERFIDTALDAFGDVHILVNNAGFVWNGPVHAISDEQWDVIQAAHLRAPFRILRALRGPIAERVAAERQAGRLVHRKVVNISSIAATGGTAGQANYSAAKAGLHGLTSSLAKEWGPLAVNVNCVAFGYIQTRLTQRIEGETTISIKGRDHRVGLTDRMIDTIRSQIALGRSGTPDEAAGAVLLMCLPESDYVTGQILEASGGLIN